MFKSVAARFALRATIMGALAGLAALKVNLADSSLSWAETVEVVYLALGASAAYAGLGAVSKSVEPSIGNKN